jgi:F420-dependent oxidoreductase-like protein
MSANEDRSPFTFGVFVPQGWKMELASIDGAGAKWAKTVELATAAERLAFDSIWAYDHVHNIPRPAHEAVFECWTTVAALSQVTSTIRLGQMVGCASYRSPALLAKITSTVDVVSGGRLDWGIGAGWYENEYLAYGYDFPPPAERIARLEDTVEIVKRMWTEPDATYAGRYHSIAGAQCDPKPLQRPHPPVWIGGAGEQLTLRVVAKHADYSNFGGDLATWTHKRDVLRSHCAAIGRDPDEISMTWSPEILICETEPEVAAAGNRSVWGGDADAWRASNLVGTAEQVCEKLRDYVDQGLSGVVAWCADTPGTETLERFARDVVPNFR